MKKNFKRMVMCITILAAAAAMTACSGHDHKAGSAWQADLKNHWQICEECGEKINLDAHVLDETGYCEACRTAVTDNGEDGYCIMEYDEQGTMAHQTEYDADGNVTFELVYESEYYEDGNPKHTKEYHDGVLLYETTYLPCENEEAAEVYESEQISYDIDGSKTISVYNEQLMLMSYTAYDADGNITSSDMYEYTYDDNGNLTKQICKTNGVVSYESEYALDSDGNAYVCHEIYYDENEGILSEARYDANGNTEE